MGLGDTGSWQASWGWAIPLILLTVIIHVTGLGWTFERVLRIRHGGGRHFSLVFVSVVAGMVLLATLLHGIEGAAWAAA